MTKEQLVLALYRIGAIRFGEFTLKSGYISPVYIDLRVIISYPEILQGAATVIWDTVTHNAYQPTLLCGVPYTALPIATLMAHLHQLPMLMRRKEKKDYGTKQLIEGLFSPNDNCLIIEDVITTGGSLLETANDLRAAGLVITDVAVLIDRQQGGYENLVQAGLQVHAALTLQDIYSILSAAQVLQPKEADILERFTGKNGQ